MNLIPSEKVVFNPHSDTSKITIISGGGAGHEPMHGGFVGENLLDAAVSGSVLLVLQQNKLWQPLKPNLIKKKVPLL